MFVDTLAAHKISSPRPLVDIPIRIGELAESARLITVPITIKGGAVGPDHNAMAVAHATQPLSLICRTRACILVLSLLKICLP